MLGQFWEKAGEGLSGKWIEHVFGPAFLFWIGGALILMQKFDFYDSWEWLTSRDVLSQTIFLIASLFIIIGSSKLMESLRFIFLRILEGYWGGIFSRLAKWLSEKKYNSIKRGREKWSVLQIKYEQSGTLTFSEKRELAQLEFSGRHAPADFGNFMPTALGNVLRSAEVSPRKKYGLDAVVCWPRLWLLLPKDVQETLTESRQSLDNKVELFAWGLFFIFWAIWWKWALLIAFGWMFFSYRLALQSAYIFADLLESVFDLYRWDLYKSTHWILPQKTGSGEVALGEQLTQFLLDGTIDNPKKYQHSD